MQVTSLLPSLTASELEHVTSTASPVCTGNWVVVFIVPVHSVFSPVQIGASMRNFYFISVHVIEMDDRVEVS